VVGASSALGGEWPAAPGIFAEESNRRGRCRRGDACATEDACATKKEVTRRVSSGREDGGRPGADPVITADEVRHIAHLARLELTDREIEWFRVRLGAILEYVAKLNEIDIENVEPTSHVILMENVLRDDVVRPSLSRDEAIGSAPSSRNGFVAAPRIIETDDSGVV